jgi:hypothetical protein
MPTGKGSEPPDLNPPAVAPEQPIPFSHKRHATAGMTCDGCHQLSSGGKQMQIPNLKQCITCHQTVKTSSPVIQKMSQLEKEGSEISWARVYQLPKFVFFSHKKHVNAKVGCEICHGPVQNQSNTRQQKQVSMVSCINCHQLRKVSTSCGLCHNVGY